MEQYLVWKVLEIDETKDEELIRQAYREKLSQVNPEEDQAGFMRLREAYEQAVEYARTEEDNQEDTWESLKDGDELDQWIYSIHCIYEDVNKRKNPEKWKEAFKADICMAFDMEADVAERLLVYIMSHHYMPMDVWQTIDAKFHYSEETEALKEKFPEDFLNYVNYKVAHEEFIDFDMFSGETGEHVDDYLYKYLDVKTMIDRFDGNNLDEIKAALDVLDDFDTYHPFADVERLRYYLLLKDEKHMQMASEKADELFAEYGENPYIAYYCGEAYEKAGQPDKTEPIWQKLIDEDPEHYMAKFGLAKIMANRGEYAEAKEYCLDLLDVDDRNIELRDFLDSTNEKLVDIYEAKLKENADDFETANKLAWCYFQQQRSDDVEKLLLGLDEKYHKEYDFINLIGRNYLAMDEHEKAMQYLPAWREIIDATEDDGSKEAKKRLNRKAFAYFAIGYCQWNLNQKEEALANLYKSFELEDKLFSKLSYMDQLAMFYLDDKEYDKAIDMCNAVIEQDRGYLPAYIKRQQAYFDIKNAQGVIDDFYECIRIYPGYIKPYTLAYKVFYFYRQYEDAQNIWNRMEEAGLHSDEMELYRFKIRRQTETGKENWGKLLEDVLAFERKHVKYMDSKDSKEQDQDEECDIVDFSEIYTELGLLFWNLDDTEAALQNVEEGIRRCGKAHGLIWLKADILMDEDRFSEAAPIWEEVLKEEPENANAYFNYGKCMHKMGEKEYQKGMANTKLYKAFEAFEKTATLNPQHKEVHFFLMRLYKSGYKRTDNVDARKEYGEKGIAHISRQIELVDDAYYYIERGLFYEEMHMLDKALEDFLKASELEPDNIYAHNNAGNICKKLRQFEMGIHEYEEALKLPNPDHNVWVDSCMADMYEAMEDYEKALMHTTEELKYHSKSVYLREELARRYLCLGKYANAQAAYDDILSFYDPYKPDINILIKKARCFYYQKLYKEAEQQYKYVLEQIQLQYGSAGIHKKNVALADAYFNFAWFYLDIDQYPKAIELYQKCIDIVNKSLDAGLRADLFDKDVIAIRNFDIAQTYFEMGDYEKAAVYAKRHLDTLYNTYGSLERYFENSPQSVPNNAFLVVFSLVMMNDIPLAEQYQKLINCSHFCSWCNHRDCYEKYYGLGLIEEAKGNFQKAYEYLEQSLKCLPPYMGTDVKRSLRRVAKRLNGNSSPEMIGSANLSGVHEEAKKKKGLFGFLKK